MEREKFPINLILTFIVNVTFLFPILLKNKFIKNALYFVFNNNKNVFS